MPPSSPLYLCLLFGLECCPVPAGDFLDFLMHCLLHGSVSDAFQTMSGDLLAPIAPWGNNALVECSEVDCLGSRMHCWATSLQE